MFPTPRLYIDLFFAGVLLAVVGGGYLYIKSSAATIRDLRTQLTTLNVQTSNLQKANEALVTSVVRVQQIQDATNRSLETIRTQSQHMTVLLQNRDLAKGDPRTVQREVNKETSNTFSRLESLSRAP